MSSKRLYIACCDVTNAFTPDMSSASWSPCVRRFGTAAFALGYLIGVGRRGQLQATGVEALVAARPALPIPPLAIRGDEWDPSS